MSTDMPRRPLGRSGIEVPLLGLGAVKLGRNQGLRHPTPFSVPDARQARRLLDCALAHGVDLIDTAPAYGSAERRLGELLHGRRDDVLLFTKTGEHFDGRHSTFDFSAEGTRRSVEASLRALRTDHLDGVLVHSNGDDADIVADGAALGTLRDLQRAGVVRCVGMSTKSVAGALGALAHVDVLMVTLAPDDADEAAMVRAAQGAGVGVLIKKALDSGHGAGDAAARLRQCAAHAGVSCIVVGTIDPDHVAANARTLSAAEPAR